MTALQNLQQTISHFVDGRRKRWQLEHELAQLEAMGSLDAVLADAGLLRSQIGPLIAGADRGELLERMLARLGIDADQLPADNQRDMMWTCTTCPHKRRCRAWLSCKEATEFRTFCPNAEPLDHAFAQQHPGAAPPAARGPDDGDYHPSSDELRQMRAEASRREVHTLLDAANLL